MEIKTILGVIEKSRYFDSNSNEEISPAYESDENWGFNYQTLYNGTQPVTDKSAYKEGTIFLDSELDVLYGKSTVSDVIIDTKGPTLLFDNCTRDSLTLPFSMSFIYESETPIDVHQLQIFLADPTTKSAKKTLYSVTRMSPSIVLEPCISDLRIDKNNTKYYLTFKLNIIDDVLTLDELNANLVCIRVWDIAGNGVEYYADGPWHYVDIDIFGLQHLVITFDDITPPTKVLSYNVEGSCTCIVYNPNKELWFIKPTIELNSESIGRIEGGSFDYSRYESEGIVTFKIVHIVEAGDVIVDAWLSIDNVAQKEIIHDKTWAEGICGPWLLIDPEGRKIKMMGYVPKYLRDEKFNEFIEFTELFLNSMYKSMSNNKNIGILEKVARIGDFNFVDRIEKPLIKHYKEEFGIEVEPNLDEISKFLMQKRIARSDETGEIVAQNFAYDEFTDDELYDFMRYVYREIPEYNQYKGSYKGMKMALNVLGMCVKIVELWARVNDSNVDDMMRADDLNDYPLRFNKSDKAIIAKYYLTSRFDVDMEETDISFKEFNDLADNIIRLIFQVKPVTRLLRKLSYIYYMWIDIHLSYLWYPEYNEQQLHHYKYKWDLAEDDCFKKHHLTTIVGKFGNYDVNDNIQYIDKLYVPFKATEGLCSFISRFDHKWIDDDPITESSVLDRIVKTKFTTNSYLTLFNIAHKIRVSDMTKLKFRINYSYTHTYYENSTTTVPTGQTGTTTITVPMSKTETITAPTLDRTIDIWDFTNGEIPDTANTVYIEEAENGFYIVFKGSTHAAFTGLNLNKGLLQNKKITIGNAAQPLSLHIYTLNEFSITMAFDCALGTDYIGQGICDRDNPCKLADDDAGIKNDLYLATLGDTDTFRSWNVPGYPYEEPERVKENHQ